MKGKNLTILVAVVVAVAAYIFFFERHRPTTDEADAQAEKVLRDLDRDQVAEIVVKTPSGEVQLHKTGEVWRLREPMDYPADESAVSTALGSLVNLEGERRLAVADIDINEYGLEPPAAAVVLRFDDGREIGFAIGEELPLGSKRTLRLDGSDEVVVTSGWFMSDLVREVDGWRSRDVVDLQADDLASVDIRTDDDIIRAVRIDDRWQLLQPLEDVADTDHITSLVSDLNSLRIDEFIDGEIDLDELGLVTPEYELMVVRADGGDPLRLLLGATRDKAGATQVVCRRGDDDYFWMGDMVRTRLSKAPVLWRSKKVAPFDTWAAESVRITAGDTSLSLLKKGGLWSFEDETEAVSTGVEDRLRSLAGLEADDYDLMAPLTAEMGSVAITFEADDETEPEVLTFTFFQPLAEGGKAMVQVSNREILMGVDAANVRTIVEGLDDLTPPPTDEDPEPVE